MKTIFFLF